MREPITPRHAAHALLALRLLIAALIAAHGWHRLLSGGYQPFGDWLSQGGWPLGHAIAIAITAFEIMATPVLALGRWLRPLCAAFIALYAMGIALVHYPAGWFVVGAGRNGMEYSVLLIGCLGVLAYSAPRSRAS